MSKASEQAKRIADAWQALLFTHVDLLADWTGQTYRCYWSACRQSSDTRETIKHTSDCPVGIVDTALTADTKQAPLADSRAAAWKRERPKVDGDYWYKRNEDADPVLVWFIDGFMCMKDSRYSMTPTKPALFSGPLTAPPFDGK